MDPRLAVLYNVASTLTFLLGCLVAYGLAGSVDVAILIPFDAGNFLYIAAADLIPQSTAQENWCSRLVHTSVFVGVLAVLLTLAMTTR
ncbi:hypothetical protein ACI3EY_06880 [Ornithinimicrobium sp. LYQ92]|uniref:hypothetical protein n=1 Tax=Serinicoccus sp. LYQ92 TaxID=3378798 RepID=UPI00385391A6